MNQHPIDNGDLGGGMNWELLTKYFAGECSPSEKQEVHNWIAADPVRHDHMNTLQQLWEATGEESLEGELASAWTKISTRIDNHPATQPIHPIPEQIAYFDKRYARLRSGAWQVLRIAAVIVVMVGIPYLVYRQVTPIEVQQELPMREIATEKGQRVKFRFTDGTQVTLNAASSIRFPERFVNGAREVTLQGEAFFDVARSETVPFVVKTRDASVRVLGTAFNVTAWPEEQFMDVVLVRGKVSVSTQRLEQSGESEVILSPGQRTSVASGGAPASPQFVNVQKYIAWQEGRLVFENTSLREVIKQLERSYDLSFQVEDTTLLNRRITATFKDESLTEMLNYMTLSLGIKYEKLGRNVTFFPAAQKKNRE